MWLPHLSGCYSVKSAWEVIRTKFPSPIWARTVWQSKVVPRWSFVLWLAVENRLSTRDRLVSWGMNVDTSWFLCSTDAESHSHLFFQCPFSSALWHEVWNKIHVSGIP